MASFLQIIRGGAWAYGSTPHVSNGMIVERVAGNNARLLDMNLVAVWDGDVDGLPRCETCSCWFISDAMFKGHLINEHGQGLAQRKQRRAVAIDRLGRLRDQLAALNEKIAVLHAEVLVLDQAIAVGEGELAAARGEAPVGA